MTSALMDPPVRLFGEAAERVRSHGGGSTLEERLQGVWRSLQADGAAECPLCRARMTRATDGGECGACGTRLR